MIGSRYKHHRNKVIYRVIEVVPLKLGETWTEAVIYKGPDMRVWSRPIENFQEKFELMK